MLFNKNLNLSNGAGKEFLSLIEKRNALIHYNATYEAFEFDNIKINGLTDIALFKSLSTDDAMQALETSKNFIEAWITLQDLEEKHIVAATQHWVGAYAM